MTSFSSRDLALHTVRLALDKGGQDLRMLQLPKGNGVADFVVIVSGTSDRNVHAIVQSIYTFCKQHRVPRMPVEGESGWMLVDCIDVVVHAFDEEKRSLYDIENLWPLARQVSYEKELKTLADPDKAIAQGE
jgi:ribosome-associated protein